MVTPTIKDDCATSNVWGKLLVKTCLGKVTTAAEWEEDKPCSSNTHEFIYMHQPEKVGLMEQLLTFYHHFSVPFIIFRNS